MNHKNEVFERGVKAAEAKANSAFNPMSLYELQAKKEHFYHKSVRVKVIREYLEQEEGFTEKFNGCVESLKTEYLKEYFCTPKKDAPEDAPLKPLESKNKRIRQVESTVDLEDTVMKMVAKLIEIGKPVMMTSFMGQAAGYLGFADTKEAVTTIGEITYYLAKAGLVRLFRETERSPVYIEYPEEVCTDLSDFVKVTQYLQPSLVEPKKLEHNRSSGYLTVNTGSLILGGAINHHNQNICLDSLNKFNSVPLSLDVRMVKELDYGNGEGIEDPDDLEQFLEFKRATAKVYAELVSQGNKFWLTHKTDKRGRTYSQGYHCTTQGDEYRKAVVELADKEYVEVPDWAK